MLSTAFALQQATQKAVHDNEIMEIAAQILHGRNEMDNEQFAKALFFYSAHLSALTTTLATEVLLTESQLNEMMDTIKELESFGKDIENGND